MKPTPERAAFLLSLHDVAPVSWPLYRDFLDQLSDLQDVRCTLLVVPHFHRGVVAADDAGFCAAMVARQARGDELVLHGYTHTDDASPPRSPGGILRRRILTHEGEFAALDERQAQARIDEGLALFHAQNWRAAGYVPPGWVSNAAGRRAITAAGFAYRTDAHALYALPSEHRLPLPTLVMSSRSAWRRTLFAALNRHRLRRFHDQSVLRLAIHPVDLRFADSRRFWLDTIRDLHGRRRSLTKQQWLAEQTLPTPRREAA
ncbi:DUF2334 domain-containing protein [Alloalcanivorax mobilis]|uniref:DUF2334 domain-containing protein n=1 Tax=Alloalcanivorax mobilis TaxID=2019569 RepID=UPI000B5B418A|nr:polysaccharide deacetylase family protein [Alloalcanivorax mobilis]ASK33974.1 DUF2334 domain-containing protein [Alcanivorax sp. N3-2A]|tara:strand:+ start:31349 stop:32128 length:780 start_codon:yes stop_codon:yes gene_type:complete